MNDSFDGMVIAPWDDETVSTLSDYQSLGIGHPYTCPRDHKDHDTWRNDPTERVLDATEAGWICPEEGCGYTQRWAHRASADRKNLIMLRQDLEELRRWA